MNKIFYFLIALILTSFSAFAQNQTFQLKVQTSPKLNGKIYLNYQYGYEKITDSAILKNGKSELKGTIKDISLAQLYFLPEGHPYVANKKELDQKSLYLEKGIVLFQADDLLKNARVNKSTLNKEFDIYSTKLSDIRAEVGKAQSAKSFNLEQRKANDAKYQEVMVEMREQLYQFINDHPSSYFSVVAINDIITSRMDMDRIEKAYNSLAPKVQKSKGGMALGEFIEREQRTKVGTMAMDFTQNDVNDKAVKLSDFRGKYILIDFWASWCVPCRVENPHLVKAYSQYKDKNFTILSVSLDNPGKKQDWLDAIAKDGLIWNHVSDLQGWKNEAAVMYGIKGVPASFLIDPSGKIIAKRLRGNEVVEKLKEILD